jgi:hypothetical protein
MTRGRRREVAVGVALMLAAGACSSGGGSGAGAPTSNGVTPNRAGSCVKNEQGTGCLPVAQDGARVDLGKPGFSDPGRISNPRFPIGELTQVLQLGHEAGEPLRVEVTRLPATKVLEWDGQKVGTVPSQFVAYRGGRIQEVAIDYYAQADDGSVWYFGEDVMDSPAAVTWRPWPWPCPRTRSLVPHRPSSGPSRPTPWGSWSWPASLNGRHPRPPSSAWARPGTRFGPPPGPRQWSPVAWATPFTPSRTR